MMEILYSHPFAHQLALCLSFILMQAPAFGYLFRVRGTDPARRPWWMPGKIVPISLMGLFTGVHSALVAGIHYGGYSWWLLGFIPAEIIALNLLLRVTWGEQFPDTNDTFNETWAPYVRKLTDWVVGFEYNEVTAQDEAKELYYKTIAWLPRYAIYGTLFAAIKCIAAFSVLPLLVWALAGVYIGVIYRHARDAHPGEDWVAKAERKAGVFLGTIIPGMLAP